MPSAYCERITTATPGCIIILLDQSGSMSDQFGADKRPKAEAAARAVNSALEELATQCVKLETLKEYFNFAIIGYGGNGVTDLLAGGSGPAGLVTVRELFDRKKEETVQVETDDGAGRLRVKEEVLFKWIEPMANGGTPMDAALQLACAKAKAWVDQHPNCFPPIILNITDGEASDPASAKTAADALRQIRTNDGDSLLFNCHLSADKDCPIEYPTSDMGLPNESSKWLFSISSELPEALIATAKTMNLSGIATGSRGFVFNATSGKLVKFLKIGTVKPPAGDK